MITINKSKTNQNFTVVPNEFLRNPNISAKAKGVYCYLTSLPDNWTIYKKEISGHFKDGYKSISNAFEELEEAGYLVSSEQQKDNGKFASKSYVLYQNPVNTDSQKGNRETPLPMAEKDNGTDGRKGDLIKKDIQKKDINPNGYKSDDLSPNVYPNATTAIRHAFCENYKKLFGNEYYWDAKSAKHAKLIYDKFVFQSLSAGKEFKDSQIPKVIEALFNASDQWMLDNMDMALLNSKFNALAKKISESKAVITDEMRKKLFQR